LLTGCDIDQPSTYMRTTWGIIIFITPYEKPVFWPYYCRPFV
jgi:hypothetical protein